ncbi:Outer membrane protein TolC [Ekhidna lutea]|uniref:Outer membrane protein TolC n=1 Tax=Ekhidna lutea TaxID=447679 RepID=A0A239KKU5_EKHLU|nr:TolC family protein [Ekhidna lutea]SNT18318.1 Outer membrane protein TolC [Ekhidna lutea]
MESSLVIKGWKLEVREIETRGWKVEVRLLDDRSWKLVLTSIFYLLISFAKAQTLENYQFQAAEQNPGLQAKYKAFEATMERIPQASSLQDPTFSFGYFISPVETRVGPQRARFSLTQMFPWFGTLKASGDVAALNAEAQYQVFLDARNKLYYQIAVAYYPLYELDKWIELESENAEILESYKIIATTKFENDQGTLVDVLRVDIMLKDALTNLEILRKKKQPLVTSFNKLLNREEYADVVVTDSLMVTDLAVNRDSLLANNPVLDELEIRLEASKKQEVLAEKQGLPKLGVGLDYVIVSERTDMSVPDNGQNALMPMVTVGIPIFRGKYKSARKEAQLMQDSYSLQKEDRINQLISGYEMADFDRVKQMELLKLYDEQITETQQVLNLLLSAYGNSGTAFEEVLRTQQQLLKYKKMKATAMMDYHVAVARLNYLTAKKY